MIRQQFDGCKWFFFTRKNIISSRFHESDMCKAIFEVSYRVKYLFIWTGRKRVLAIISDIICFEHQPDLSDGNLRQATVAHFFSLGVSLSLSLCLLGRIRRVARLKSDETSFRARIFSSTAMPILGEKVERQMPRYSRECMRTVCNMKN